MAVVPWRPISELASMHSMMDRLFNETFGDMFEGMQGRDERQEGRPPTFQLPVDIMETENGYRIKAPVPGFKPEEVEVTYADGTLAINANHREERTEERGSVRRREIAFGNYRRQIPLPGDVRADDIHASFENGMLTVDVPSAPRPQPVRIPISAVQSEGGQAQDSAGRRSEAKST